jgi:hypothetical protein
MLQNLNIQIRERLHRAEECKRLAETAMTEAGKADYLKMEQRWLSLARSYEFCGAAIEFRRAIQEAAICRSARAASVGGLIAFHKTFGTGPFQSHWPF